MIFFPAIHMDGIRSGRITLSFRAWDRARVKAGSLQRSHPIGVVAIDEVSAVTVGAISEDDAKRAGYATKKALVASLAERADAPLTTSSVVWRVVFHHAGDADHASNANDAALGPDDVAAIKKALAAFDGNSKLGPWTKKTLALIAKRPNVPASQLALDVKRDTASFKADVVKLKKLGLTQSFSAGYDLTPRGRAYREAASRSSWARKSGSKTPSTRTE